MRAGINFGQTFDQLRDAFRELFIWVTPEPAKENLNKNEICRELAMEAMDRRPIAGRKSRMR